ncbi:MAG: alpha/beta hydrolase [Clostridiales Family XIII bacterium]|jgi:acetyl esterase/lipase|nr:alpha/beta hydrolase [Clostridiales Family XIII bacterium]
MKKKALICPGGGYQLIGTNEGEPVARRFAERGYDACVLSYATGARAVFTGRGFADFEPARELADALAQARAGAGPDGFIILAGFSAGGHLAAGYCLTHAMGDDVPLPDALMLSYPMLQLGSSYQVDNAARAAFDIPAQVREYGLPDRAKNLPIHIWHSTTDEMVPYESSPAFVKLLEAAGARVHFTKFEAGRHGDPATTPGWFEAAMEYIENRYSVLV